MKTMHPKIANYILQIFGEKYLAKAFQSHVAVNCGDVTVCITHEGRGIYNVSEYVPGDDEDRFINIGDNLTIEAAIECVEEFLKGPDEPT